jgi:hypothetical protein
MKIKEFKLVTLLLGLMGLDIGANVNTEAEVPEDWLERFARAEEEARGLSADEAVTLTQGEEAEMAAVAKKAPVAFALLEAAFDDGQLAELVFAPWQNIFEARDAEAKSRALIASIRASENQSQSEHAAGHRDGEEER